jgi:hypothetical protein
MRSAQYDGQNGIKRVPRVGILYITYRSHIFSKPFWRILYWAPLIGWLRQTRALIGGNISRIFSYGNSMDFVYYR